MHFSLQKNLQEPFQKDQIYRRQENAASCRIITVAFLLLTTRGCSGSQTLLCTPQANLQLGFNFSITQHMIYMFCNSQINTCNIYFYIIIHFSPVSLNHILTFNNH